MRNKENEKRLSPDMRKVAEYIVHGQKRRSKTVATHEAGRFDKKAFDAVNAALRATAGDIENGEVRSNIHRKLLLSVDEHVPFRYLGDCFCSEQKFFTYRTDFLVGVLKELKMM